MLGLAETKGFRTRRGRHLVPAQATAFADCVREALADPPASPPGRGGLGRTPAAQLKDYFEDPANRNVLQRIVALAESGGGLDVTEA